MNIFKNPQKTFKNKFYKKGPMYIKKSKHFKLNLICLVLTTSAICFSYSCNCKRVLLFVTSSSFNLVSAAPCNKGNIKYRHASQ